MTTPTEDPQARKTDRALKRFKSAKDEHSKAANVLKQIGDYARPSNDNAGYPQAGAENTKTTEKHVRLFDTTLAECNEKQAAGIKSWLAPAAAPFFKLKPPRGLETNDKCIAWCNTVTTVLHEDLNGSMFHTADHEVMLDRGAYGYGAIMVDEDEEGLLFQYWEAGTFYVLENSRGMIDSVFREKMFTHRQAAEKFGEANLPDDVKQALKSGDANKAEEKHNYIFCCYPRVDAERDGGSRQLPNNMKFAVYWIHETKKKIVFESGYPEMPVIVSRYLRWGESLYGRGPALLALATARQLNRTEERLDQATDLSVFPALNVPAAMAIEDVDLGPGGINFYGSPNELITPIRSTGSVSEMSMRAEQRRQTIRAIFSLDIFEAVSRKTKEMTAEEARIVSQEAIFLFSPMFTRVTVEHYNRVIMRLFSMRLRASEQARALGFGTVHFPPIPQEMLRPVDETSSEVLEPSVSYTSRIALELSAISARAARSTLADRVQLAPALGEAAFDDLDIPTMLKMVAREEGLPENCFLSDEAIQANKQARAEAQQQMAEAQQLEQTSKAVANVSKATAA